MSALILALTLAVAQPAPETYRARGTMPSWSLVIDEGRLRYEPADGLATEMPVPPPDVAEGIGNIGPIASR